MTTEGRLIRDLPEILGDLAMGPYPDYIDDVLALPAVVAHDDTDITDRHHGLRQLPGVVCRRTGRIFGHKKRALGPFLYQKP